MEKLPCVYILTNKINGILYVGVTSHLLQRVWQHKNMNVKGFASDHGLKNLVWYGFFETMENAIVMEKRLKKWNRKWKIRLIEKGNPRWKDLYDELGY